MSKKDDKRKVIYIAISVATILLCVCIYGVPNPLQSLDLKTSGLIISAFSTLAIVVNGIILKKGETAAKIVAAVALLLSTLLLLFGLMGINFSSYQF